MNELNKYVYVILIFHLLLFFTGNAFADIDASRIVKDVIAEGSCAVVGMSAEQSQIIALKSARRAAIEQAVGTRLTSNTVITNARLAMDYMRTYSDGYIIKETIEWLPIEQYYKNKSTPPVLEYKVRIMADVYKPEKKINPLGLTAHINEAFFRNGEEGQITVNVERKAKVAIFNITADDKVVMFFPNQYEEDNTITGGESFVFPDKSSPVSLVFRTLPGHKRDAEAVFVVAMDSRVERGFLKMFSPLEKMGFSDFFAIYSEIADVCEDQLLTYEVSGD